MGLIGSYLGALYCGGCGYYLSPASFIRNPVLWMVAMSRYRATHVQAPNFAYALTARKFLAHVQRGAGGRRGSAMDIDESFSLASLRHMINAAEPVEASAIDLLYAGTLNLRVANPNPNPNPNLFYAGTLTLRIAPEGYIYIN